MHRGFMHRLATAATCLIFTALAHAQTPPPERYVPTTPAFRALPDEVQRHVTDMRQSCIDVVPRGERAEFNYVPANEMSGIHEAELGGWRAVIVDSFDVCTSDVTGGNCHNRGCYVNVWVQMDGGAWRLVPSRDVRVKGDAALLEPEWLDLAPRYRAPECKGQRAAESCTLRWRFRRLTEAEKIPIGR